jgi:DNA-directed RNA polymerase subunit omega
MLDELKDQEIIAKVGGKFKLTALVQKRMTEIMQGARPLIDNPEGLTMLEIVAQEIIQDKISIEDSGLADDSSEQSLPII